MQKERDRRAGLNTAGYRHRLSRLAARRARPAVLARRAASSPKPTSCSSPASTRTSPPPRCWGTQQAELRGEGKYDGVFGIWYGKGPGVDRSGDVFRHANLAGTSKHGGVLALMGDDHTAESSTTAHQSEFAFVDVMIPILNPAGVQEIIDYGLYGFALSRFAGTWAALKCVQGQRRIDRRRSMAASIACKIVMPDDFDMPPGGLNIRLRDHHPRPGSAAARLQARRACSPSSRANKLNRIVTSGGAQAEDRHHHHRQELSRRAPGARRTRHRRGQVQPSSAFGCYKVGCPWPLEPAATSKAFADGLDLIIVVEEKRSLIEVQVREELYGTANQPAVHRQEGRARRLAVPGQGRARSQRDRDLHRRAAARRAATTTRSRRRCRALKQAQHALAEIAGRRARACPISAPAARTIPRRWCRRASRAYAGIGCHYMAQWMDRSTRRLHPDGRRGRATGSARRRSRSASTSSRISATAPTTTPALWRSAPRVAAGVNITYKILFNDAVAMTGGQAHDGGLTVPQIARAGRGRRRRAHRRRHRRAGQISGRAPTGRAGITVHHRDELDAVQRELARDSTASRC